MKEPKFFSIKYIIINRFLLRWSWKDLQYKKFGFILWTFNFTSVLWVKGLLKMYFHYIIGWFKVFIPTLNIFKFRALLLAMSILAEKSGDKILLSKNRFLSNQFSSVLVSEQGLKVFWGKNGLSKRNQGNFDFYIYQVSIKFITLF